MQERIPRPGTGAGGPKRLCWSWDAHGVPMRAGHDPGVRGSRWLEFEVARLLPIGQPF